MSRASTARGDTATGATWPLLAAARRKVAFFRRNPGGDDRLGAPLYKIGGLKDHEHADAAWFELIFAQRCRQYHRADRIHPNTKYRRAGWTYGPASIMRRSGAREWLMECVACQATLAVGVKFCSACGAAVPSLCIACGTLNSSAANFLLGMRGKFSANAFDALCRAAPDQRFVLRSRRLDGAFLPARSGGSAQPDPDLPTACRRGDGSVRRVRGPLYWRWHIGLLRVAAGERSGRRAGAAGSAGRKLKAVAASPIEGGVRFPADASASQPVWLS